jgi:hypothetical protein
MGYIKHNAIIVTSFDLDQIKQCHKNAIDIFFDDHLKAAPLVSDILEGVINNQYSIFIAPDGSKEGWPESDEHDLKRESFIDWIKKNDMYVDYIEVRFGGDDYENEIVNSNKD